MTPLSDSFLTTLASYLEGQRMAGVRELEWSGPLPGETDIQPPSPPPPSRPAPAPALERKTPDAPLPPAQDPEPVAGTAVPSAAWVRAFRHPDCRDENWPSENCILVVSTQEEFEDEAGGLMQEMLKAIGFTTRDAPADLHAGVPEDAVRILIFGNHALQQVSSSGMALQLVRGRWRECRYGKFLATYAPSSVLDSPSGKKTVWSDLQNLMADLGLEIPEWTKKKLKRTP